jgi:predicted nucleic acid-binding protein
MIILDTNVVSELMRPSCNPIVERWVNAQVADTLFLSACNLSELLLGIEQMPAGRRKESHRTLLTGIAERVLAGRVLPFDEPAARAYAGLMVRARQKGRAISVMDGQIAAVAQVHGFTVATRDTSPFEAAGIPFINPWLA